MRHTSLSPTRPEALVAGSEALSLAFWARQAPFALVTLAVLALAWLG